MSAFGAAVGRRVWLEKNPFKIKPMLNVLLIGPSGAGKSTSVMLARKLIDNCPDQFRPQYLSGQITVPQLHATLTAKPKALFFASELAATFTKQDYNKDFVPYITELLDYPDTVVRSTKKDSVQTIIEPSVSIIGASTVSWLQDMLPGAAAKGGFLPRFLIVYEEHKGQRVAFPSFIVSDDDRPEYDQRQRRIYDAFARAVMTNEGEIKLKDYAAHNVYIDWYNTQKPEIGQLEPFSARAGEMILRMSILLALSCQRKSITTEDVQSAIALSDYVTSNLSKVVTASTIEGQLLQDVLLIIGNDDKTDDEIFRAMSHKCTAQQTKKFLDSLMSSKQIALVDGSYRRARIRKSR